MDDLTAGAGCLGQTRLPDVVYSFTPATSGPHVFEVKGTKPVLLWLAEGRCEGAACIAWANTTLSANLTAGRQYFVVLEGANLAGQGFTVRAATPPSNDVCIGALPLDLSTPRAGTTYGATHELGKALPGPCLERSVPKANGPDVLYRFVAQAAGNFLASVSAATWNPRLFVHGAACPETDAACRTASRTGLQSGKVRFRAAQGETVFLAVDGDTVEEQGDFTIRVDSVPILAGDTCATALELTPGTPVQAPTSGLVDDLSPVGLCDSVGPRRDLVTRFVPTKSGLYAVTASGASEVWMTDGTCDGARCTRLLRGGYVLETDLTAGQIYFFVAEVNDSATGNVELTLREQ
jgi:hypothetical protein